MSSALDKAYQAIRASILSGEYAGGAPLREEELAATVGVSRTPIREALRRLATQGLVDVVPNHGARVASLSRGEIEELFDLRCMLEGYAAQRAAQRSDASALARLDALVGEMEETARANGSRDVSRLARLNEAFHQALLDSAGSSRLRTMVTDVIVVSLMLRTFRVETADELQQSIEHHRELVRALRARDPEWAKAVIHNHLRSVWHTIAPLLNDT